MIYHNPDLKVEISICPFIPGIYIQKSGYIDSKLSRDVKGMEHEGNFALGFSWAFSLSIPLWISFLGWIKLLFIIL
jgi:hypothetical protein